MEGTDKQNELELTESIKYVEAKQKLYMCKHDLIIFFGNFKIINFSLVKKQNSHWNFTSEWNKNTKMYRRL